jgi:hypothetical protein
MNDEFKAEMQLKKQQNESESDYVTSDEEDRHDFNDRKLQ